ncbi:DegT/DnrJ/EryC1/StrS aminotransferase family protein [Selenomonas sp. AE3005]|uniref:DegT/DnrJ/EryC1/StrS family aminotransferase n=1 Tax=Selenomonas sp. AE3005 TaxID=1485543 RepID=UPI000487CB6B|nr:DegT/DnrJ/EryC1/StrS aminotransferase family protein [Selenomonas sp. AE3005]
MGIQLFKANFAVEACLKQVRECLEKGWTGMGFKTVELEEAWKEYTGHKYAYYLNSNTAGLYMAVDTLKEVCGWDNGDEIISTPLTFISTNHAIAKNNMNAVFADVDDTLCLDPQSVEEHITDKTRAVIFVGLGGNTGRLGEVKKICKNYGLKLIIDAAHMAGTRYRDGSIPGANGEADITVYSFQAVKNLPTGDSGMICTDDAELDEIFRKKAWLGINKDTYTRAMNKEGTYKWKYNVEYVGDKYNGNSIMAGIALAQLPFLDRDNAYRRTLAQWYTDEFAQYPNQIGLVTVLDDCISSRHLYQIFVNDRDGLMMYLNANDVYPGVHYMSNTEYSMYSYAKGSCVNADFASNHIISLPMHMEISHKDVKYIAKLVVKYLMDIRGGERLK